MFSVGFGHGAVLGSARAVTRTCGARHVAQQGEGMLAMGPPGPTNALTLSTMYRSPPSATSSTKTTSGPCNHDALWRALVGDGVVGGHKDDRLR